MGNLFLSIGGVRLATCCPPGIELLPSDPSYSEFVCNEISGDAGAADICIDISFGRAHDTKNLRDCFRTGQSWSLFREGDNYLLAFQREGSEEFYMTARLSHDISRVELFCSGEFIDDQGRACNLVKYPLDQILLMQYLVRHEGLIAHSAGISVDGRGYLFPGFSGAGKSTISRSLSGGDNIMLLSDDRMIVRKEADAFVIYGTPWPGDAEIAVNKSASLKGVLFLEKSIDNVIHQIDEAEALRRFMSVLSVPWYDRDSISGALSLVSELISRVPSYVLQFKPGKKVVDTIEEFISA